MVKTATPKGEYMDTINTILPHLIRPGTEKIWEIFESVYDPEIPVLSVLDLGIIRDIEFKVAPVGDDWESTTITITPTYSGCPAMDMIAMNIRLALLEHGYKNIEIKTVLSPAW